MSIVIQDLATREYAADAREWVFDPHSALTFNDARKAVAFCRRHELGDVRFLAFQEGKLSLLLYVPGSKAPSPTGILHRTIPSNPETPPVLEGASTVGE
jgi:hypothetical protein